MNDDTAALEKLNALFQATDSNEGEQEAIKLIREGVDPTVCDDMGHSLLHYAAARGHKQLIELLLKQGCNLNQRDQHGWTPLAMAASEFDGEALSLWLIDRGADPLARDQDGQSVFHHACHGGHQTLVKQLLDRGADLNQENDQGNTPLLYAANSPKGEEIALFLLEQGADPTGASNMGIILLHVAANSGHTKLAAKLLDDGADCNAVDGRGLTPLLLAAASQQGEATAFLLLERGADPFVTGHEGETSLLFAASAGHQKLILALLDKGVPIDQTQQEGHTPLMAAASSEQESAALLLLDRGANPHCINQYGGTALFPACIGKQMQLVKRLVACGLDVNQTTESGQTPLTTTAREEDGEQVALYLLEKGANPLIIERDGTAALDCASHMGHIALIDALLDKGADINRPSLDGNTPLIWAAGSQHGEAAALHLLDRGADPLATKDHESTALHIAAYSGHAKLVIALVNRGVDVNYKGCKGCTPLMVAAFSDQGEQAALALLDVGADPTIADEANRSPLMGATLCNHEQLHKRLEKMLYQRLGETSGDGP